MTGGRVALLLTIGAAGGCGSTTRPTPASPPTPRPAIGSRHNGADVGTIRGQVTWEGRLPDAPPFSAPVPTAAGYQTTSIPNPFAPAIDPASGGLADAVVSLSGVDPAVGKPWTRPPVRVEVRDFRIGVCAGNSPPGRVGFTRAGDDVSFTSFDAAHHMLRARGAAFFTLPLPEPNKPLVRRLDTPGVVELTSGAGYYWAAADLFVCDHPYYESTGRDGRFALAGVPSGRYELVCRVRNWRVVRSERDPESGLVFRQAYAPPVEKRVPVTINAGDDKEVGFRFAVTDFEPR